MGFGEVRKMIDLGGKKPHTYKWIREYLGIHQALSNAFKFEQLSEICALIHMEQCGKHLTDQASWQGPPSTTCRPRKKSCFEAFDTNWMIGQLSFSKLQMLKDFLKEQSTPWWLPRQELSLVMSVNFEGFDALVSWWILDGSGAAESP